MRVELLAADIEHGQRARPDLSREALVVEALRRGIDIAAAPIEVRVPDDLPADERIRRLHTLFATTAASIAELRFLLVANRTRYENASSSERRAFMEFVELDRDVVPPLKLEARRLRQEVRRLEAEAARRGIDIDTIRPTVDWPTTLAVDAYEPPKYVDNQSRRRAAVEFFRRQDER